MSMCGLQCGILSSLATVMILLAVVVDVDVDGQEASRAAFHSTQLDSAPTAVKHNEHQPTKLQIPAAMYSSPSAKKPSAYKAAPRTFVTSAPQCPRCDKVGGGMMGWSY